MDLEDVKCLTADWKESRADIAVMFFKEAKGEQNIILYYYSVNIHTNYTNWRQGKRSKI
jgi:hypothetical protein